MVKVERTAKPNSLVENAERWTQELAEQTQLKGSYADVSDTYKNRYRQEDVKQALETMYGEKCCYCETGIGVTSYEQIEHRKPKALPQFHDQAFEWENLHWSCQICNNKKSNKWNEEAPILDAAEDDPADYLDFDLETCEAVPKGEDGRARTTIDHAQLNRRKLIRARERTRDRAMLYILKAHETESPHDEQFYKEELQRMVTNDLENGNLAEYTMLIRKVIATYL